MKASKKEVVDAIMLFAKEYGLEKNYETLMATYLGLPKIIEMIVYEMFLHKFSYYHSRGERYDNYMILLEYATELKENGWVNMPETNKDDLNYNVRL